MGVESGRKWEKAVGESEFYRIKRLGDRKMVQLFPLGGRLNPAFPTFFDASG